MNEKVSIIIPVYNTEKYLKKCIESVLNQTYKNFELILVNDGSNDNSGKICDEYSKKDNRIKVIHKSHHTGVSNSRNIAIEKSTGNYIYILDSDDWIEINTIELMIGKIINTNSDVCFSDFIKEFYNRKSYIKIFDSEKDFYKKDEKNSFSIFMSNCNIGGVMLNSDIITKVKFNEKIISSEDMLFKFEIFGHINSFVYLKKFLYHYRSRRISLSNDNYSPENDIANSKMVFLFIKNIAKENKYPLNKFEVINAIYLNCFFSPKKSYWHIKQYMNLYEFTEACNNYDKIVINKKAKIALKYIIKFKSKHIKLFIIYSYFFLLFIFDILHRKAGYFE